MICGLEGAVPWDLVGHQTRKEGVHTAEKIAPAAECTLLEYGATLQAPLMNGPNTGEILGAGFCIANCLCIFERTYRVRFPGSPLCSVRS